VHPRAGNVTGNDVAAALPSDFRAGQSSEPRAAIHRLSNARTAASVS
jgi:hypothetical protein